MAKTKNEFAWLESAIGHSFKHRNLLRQALTHSSFAYEHGPSGKEERPIDNEQMEFLGDAVLGFVAGRALYDRFPGFEEGQLSRARSQLVSAQHLTAVAKRWKLGQALRLGRGEDRSHGREKPAILADTVEAVIAAVYLDAGIMAARKVILRQIVTPELQRLAESDGRLTQLDHKSALQEHMQATKSQPPSYHVVETLGPDHRRIFTIEVQLRRLPGTAPFLTGSGSGPSKKIAEQLAAADALGRIQNK